MRLREWYEAFVRFGKGNERTVHEFLEAAALIESLVAELAQVKQERNQAVEDLRNLPKLGVSNCVFCLHYTHGEGDKTCIVCGCKGMDLWQWRGVTKEANDDG